MQSDLLRRPCDILDDGPSAGRSSKDNDGHLDRSQNHHIYTSSEHQRKFLIRLKFWNLIV